MRAPLALALAILLGGCAQPGAQDDRLCEAPLEHFQGRVDWANLTGGSLYVPPGWPIPADLAPAPGAVLTQVKWRADGQPLAREDLDHDSFQMGGDDYLSPPKHVLRWETSGPVLAATYDRDVAAETIAAHVGTLLDALGGPADPQEWTERFLATGRDDHFGPTVRDLDSGMESQGAPTAKTYTLAWEGADPAQTRLPQVATATEWHELSLLDGPFGFSAALPDRSYSNNNATTVVRILASSDGDLWGEVSVLDESRDRHALVNATLAANGVAVHDLAFMVGPEHGLTTQLFDC